MIEAIGARDFQVISAMTYIGAILFVIFNLITDICYSIVDPRITFE
jgi:peptide/nickel transport system permease protein